MNAFARFCVFCVAALTLPGSVQAAGVPVTFRVDMSEQINRGYFSPATDTIEARGDFNIWSGGFTLTNNPLAANTNVYSGVYNYTNPPGSLQQYKFVKKIGGNDYWEDNLTPATSGNRTFNLDNTAQVLPVVYFNDLTPTNGVPTHPVTFQVDMSVQLTNGNFNPSNLDTIEVRGTFQMTNQWSGGFKLTNSPGNTNVYKGTYNDANYPGTQEAYKFVIVRGFDQWESVDNRPLTLQSNGQTLPVVFFDNIPGTLVPVTFRVDMTVPVLSGTFLPGFDSVEARGTFQAPGQWNGGFVLTNEPIGGNTNIYSGTYMDPNAPGTSEQYKFVINGFNWERPTSSGGGNRTFTLATNAQTLPIVRFSDLGTNDVLSADTLVTFRVNMTNAVGTDNIHFDPLTNSVYLNGEFLGWWGWGQFPPGQYQMTNVGASRVYSLAVLFPKWSPLMLTYKYGIDGFDDEAPFKSNHVRYIRATNAYVMPLDVFGTQTVEPEVGPLVISLVSNQASLTWNGRPGVHLQSTTNIQALLWNDVTNTTGQSAALVPLAPGKTFFRLIKP